MSLMMREQRVRRIFDRVQIVPLLVGESRVQRQFGHADDAVHRSADLVAHVGEEFALGAAAGLGFFLGRDRAVLAATSSAVRALTSCSKRSRCSAASRSRS